MSRAVDEKIVKMSVDNTSFMSKVKETLSGLTSLSRGAEKVKDINVSKADSSVRSLGQSLSRISTEKLASGIENVKNRFSILKEIGVGALRGIGSNLASTAINTVKDWSGVTQGFNEYGEKMKAVQVITANTQGKSSAQEISTALDNLNHYADKTVYSFTDMTTSIGTFTAAGVGLNDATDAIQGLSNWAAESGTNTTDLSRAEVQLSQALASGTVRLQDWTSVQNAGGLGGKKFQVALENTAKSMGKGRDMTKSFRDSLQDGWLTSEVLLKTLRKFKEDKSMEKAATQAHTFDQAIGAAKEAIQSGWGAVFEDLFGNLEQSTKLWTALQNAMTDVINNRFSGIDAVVKSFVKLGGIRNVTNIVINGFTLLKRTLGAVSKGFHDVFPPMTGKRLNDIVAGINIFIARIMPANKQLEQIRKISRGVFSLFDIGVKAVKALADVFKSLIPDGTGGGLLELAANIGDMITNFDKGLTPGNSFKKMLDGVHNASNKVAKAIGGALSSIGKFGGWLITIGKTIKNAVSPAFEIVAKAIAGFIKSISFKDVLGASGIGVLAVAVHKFGKLKDSIVDFMDKIKEVLSQKKEDVGILDTLKESLSNLTTGLKVATLVEIAAAVTALALSLKLLSTIKGGDLAKSLEAMIVSLIALSKASDYISKLSFNKGAAIKGALTITALANAVLVMAAALKVMSTIDGKDMAKSLAALATTVVLLVGAVTLMSKAGGKMSASSLQIGALAVAVLTISAALKVMSGIKASSLAKSLIALGAVLVELAAFVALVNKQKLNPSTAAGVLAVSAALLIISGAMTVMARIKADDIVKGLGAMAGILAEVVAFTKLMQGSSVLGAAVGLTSVAVAMNLMVIPMAAFGAMSWESIAKGLVTVGVALGEVVAAMALANGSLAGAAAITLVAAALNLLVPPIVMLGHLSIGQLAIALGGLAGVFAIIAVASIPMSAGAIGLLAFAAAIGAIGLAVLAIGTGLAAFATALTALASLTANNISAIINNFNDLLKGVGSIIPNLIKIVVNAVVALAQGLATAIPAIAEAGWQVIEGLLQAMANHIGDVVNLASQIIIDFANGLADNVGPLIEAGLNLIVQFIDGMANGIRDNGPQIVAAVMNLIESVLELVITGLQAVLTTLVGWFPGAKGLISGFGDSAKGALRGAFDVTDVGAQGGTDFANGVNSKSGAANASGKSLAQNAKLGAVVSLNGEGAQAGSTFAGGANGQRGAANGAGKSLAANAKLGAVTSLNGEGSHAGSTYASGAHGQSGNARGAGAALARSGRSGAGSTDWSSAGKNAGLGFGRGISHAKDAVVGFAQGLASSALGALKSWLRIKSPSRKAMVLGDYFGQGFGVGIDGQTKNVISKSTNLAKNAISAIKSQAGYINDAMNDAMSVQPVITPTVDTSGIDSSNLNMSGTIKADDDLKQPINTTTLDISRNVKMIDNGLLTQMSALSAEIRNSQDALRSTIANGLSPVTGILDALKEHYGSNEPIYLMMNDKVVGSVFGPVIDQKQGSTISLTARGLAR